jgi:hypothetical protein
MRTASVLLALFALLGALAPAISQDRVVRVVGVVQWMSVDTMMVIPDNGGLPIEVDITNVDQSQYETLTEGSPVIVVGTVAPEGRRVMATAIISRGGGLSSGTE